MIQIVLKKCLDNLNAETPDLSYVRGMLEVLLAMQERTAVPTVLAPENLARHSTGDIRSEQPKDEGAILDATARASIDKIKAIADKSTE